jgi:hypothetical protein
VHAHDSLKDQDTETSTTEQKKGNYEEKRHCTNWLNNNIWEQPIQNIQKSTIGREKREKYWGKPKKNEIHGRKRNRTERKRGRNTKVIMKPLQDRENRRIIIRNKEGKSPEIAPEALKRTPAERKNENKTKLTPSK